MDGCFVRAGPGTFAGAAPPSICFSRHRLPWLGWLGAWMGSGQVPPPLLSIRLGERWETWTTPTTRSVLGGSLIQAHRAILGGGWSRETGGGPRGRNRETPFLGDGCSPCRSYGGACRTDGRRGNKCRGGKEEISLEGRGYLLCRTGARTKKTKDNRGARWKRKRETRRGRDRIEHGKIGPERTVVAIRGPSSKRM